MPLMVSRSARSKEYLPLTGVRPGSPFTHGPNVPLVVISPFGIGLLSVATKGIVRLKPTDSRCRS